MIGMVPAAQGLSSKSFQKLGTDYRAPKERA
jgi:hypothetical protein